MTSTAHPVRRALVVIHRWIGLSLALFLILVAATGAVLPWQADLQRSLAPERFVSAPRAGAIPLNWSSLRRRAEALSGGRIDMLPLYRQGDAAVAFAVAARDGAPPLDFDEIVLDPYSGREIARDRVGDLRSGRAEVIPFIYRLHESLALGDLGTAWLGIIALAWTIDCFVGFYLTLPAAWRWCRWIKAWRVRWPSPSRFRLSFDLHRASGLWLWPMLFVFAWSGTGFNLPSIYVPVMSALTGFQAEAALAVSSERQRPHMDWDRALALARIRARETLSARGVTVLRERELRFSRSTNVYAYAIRTSRDRSDQGANSWVYLDGNSGHVIGTALPTGERIGNTIDYWLGLLHEAQVFGVPYRVAVSLCGVLTVMLTITGILVWRLKKRARKRASVS